SVGYETTFERDTADARVLHDTRRDLTERVAQRLRANRVRGRTVTLKFREADFTTCTRRETLENPADTAGRIFPVVFRLMRSLIRKGKLVRLIGVYASNLTEDKTGQLALFDLGQRKDRDLAAAVDNINRRFGESAITRAALVSPGLRRTRHASRKDAK